jgi:hypothetical protein
VVRARTRGCPARRCGCRRGRSTPSARDGWTGIAESLLEGGEHGERAEPGSFVPLLDGESLTDLAFHEVVGAVGRPRGRTRRRSGPRSERVRTANSAPPAAPSARGGAGRARQGAARSRSLARRERGGLSDPVAALDCTVGLGRAERREHSGRAPASLGGERACHHRTERRAASKAGRNAAVAVRVARRGCEALSSSRRGSSPSGRVSVFVGEPGSLVGISSP